MPMIVSKKQRIFFALEGEAGPFLLLHHGLFGSHRDWYDWGYVEALESEFRLIIPDARGHGRSEKPVVSSLYDLPSMAADMVALLDELDVRNVNFLGHSLGALVGLELASRFPGRLRCAVLGGASPFVTGEMVETWRALGTRLESESAAAVLQDLRGQHGLAVGDSPLPEEAEESAYPRTLLQAMAGWEINTAERLSVTPDLALVAGDQGPGAQPLRDARDKISRARLFTLSGVTTVEAVMERGQLLKEALAFIRESRQTRNGESRSTGRGRGRGRHGRSRRPSQEERTRRDSSEANSTPQQPEQNDNAGGEPMENPPAPGAADVNAAASPPAEEAGAAEAPAGPTPGDATETVTGKEASEKEASGKTPAEEITDRD